MKTRSLVVTIHTVGRFVENLTKVTMFLERRMQMKKVVVFTMMAWLPMSANTYADVVAMEGTAGSIYYSNGSGYSVAGGGLATGFAAGTVLAGTGNGVGFAHEGGDGNIYAVTATSDTSIGAFAARTIMAGLGDGTALAKENAGVGSIYLLTSTGYSVAGGGLATGFAAGTVLASHGNGVGFAHEGGDGNIYAVTATSDTSIGAFAAGTDNGRSWRWHSPGEGERRSRKHLSSYFHWLLCGGRRIGTGFCRRNRVGRRARQWRRLCP